MKVHERHEKDEKGGSEVRDPLRADAARSGRVPGSVSRFSFCVLSCVSGTFFFGLAAEAAEPVTFKDHILPVFKNACLNCHNPDKKKAGLDLSTYQGALQGGENGPVLDSGNPAASLLFKCVKQTEEPKMPPKGDKLNDAELALVEKWIAGQLLESAGGKVVAAAKNNVQVAMV
ncbi:MAG TPA: c-type cytochrome domain-containing protein, partial [Chthoniobacteraceae bacterium]